MCPEGIAVCHWVLETAGGLTAFYDIDTPVTAASVANDRCTYLTADLMPRFDLYLSFSGGPFLAALQQTFGIAETYPLYCSADPATYYPQQAEPRYDLGYMGTYSPDRQPGLQNLLLQPARDWRAGRFVVAGPQYPEHLAWPDNVQRLEHIGPQAHRDFYASQRFTLNLTRADMVRAGGSPSIRLFEAAACATPIISDYWPGLEDFFIPDKEILISRSAADTLHFLRHTSEEQRLAIGEKARQRVLSAHTPDHRAVELENIVRALWHQGNSS